MDKQAQILNDFIFSAQEKMIDQIEQWSNINSGTTHLMGLKKMREVLQEAFSPISDEIHAHTFAPIETMQLNGQLVTQQYGDLLFIRKRPHLKRRLLLSGHMDTVYAENHPFQTVKKIAPNQLNGPGVADMKGGLLIMLYALSAFEKNPIASQLGWDVVINADEEIGSLTSRHFFENIAKNYSTALVYEPAMSPEGGFAKNRRGSGKLTIVAIGKAAHAGRDFDSGRNAISYLAEIIVAIHALNGCHPGVTINIGQICGGTALNIVPDKAVIKMDIRITQFEDEQWVREKLKQIFKKFKRPDYQLQLYGHFDRPVKKINEATTLLFKRIQHIGKTLNLQLDWKDSGGCCDGNNFSALGLAVIDTLGVRGDYIHSSNEYILIDSLAERSMLSALLLTDLAMGTLEKISTSNYVTL